MDTNEVHPVNKTQLFDDWPERYDQWFETPIGRLIKHYEGELILEMLKPGRGERILDVGCGTGIFTQDVISAGSRVVGLDFSSPMLQRAGRKFKRRPFYMIQGDLRDLPFGDNRFDKVVSVTAIEFIEDGRSAVGEVFRVTKPGGIIVVASLNSLGPWATRRNVEAEKGHPIFKHAFFRSPQDMHKLSPVAGTAKTAIHFQKDDDPEDARTIEEKGRAEDLDTGAFVVARWQK
jgi:ubiquinone/menaquinone biosynthesis C-methylase UbiE